MADHDAPSRRNLNFFYTLDAILNAPTLTQAAVQTSLSQPALSMALKKARIHFDDEIVTYVGGRRELTALAVALRPRVRRALRDAQQILELSLDFDPATDARTIRISMPDFVEVLFLPHVLRIVRAVAPKVDLQIVPFEYWPAARQFEKDVDFVIVPTPLVDTAFGSLSLYDEHLGIMIAKINPLVAADTISIEQYLDGSHAALFNAIDMLTPTRGTVAELLGARKVVVRTATYAALPRMIVDTDLIVTTSARYAQYCASIMDLATIPLPVPAEPVAIVVQWQMFRASEPALQWFVEILREATASI